MARESRVQSQIESYQRLKNGTCLARSIIKLGSRLKQSNLGKGVAPSLHLGVVVIEKGAFGSTSTKVTNFTYIYTHMSCSESSKPYPEKSVFTDFLLLLPIYYSCVCTCIYIYIYIYIYMCVCVCVCVCVSIYIYIYIYIYISGRYVTL